MGRVGESEQAAIGLVSVYYLILFMIGYAYTKGTQILVARRIGENKPEEAGHIFDNSMAVILVLSLLMFLYIKLLSGFTLRLLIEDFQVRTMSQVYLDTRSYGIFFGFTGSVFLAFYMGTGRMIVILISIFSMSVLNIALNYIFIFGKLGLPAMGIAGAAMASNIAELLATVIFLFHSLWKKLYIKYHLFRLARLSLRTIGQITALSLPIVLQTVIGLSAWMIFFTFVEKMGAHELAISSVVKSIYILFGIPSWGFSAATNTVVSNLMGQGQPKQVSRGIKKIIVLSFGITSLLTLSLAAFPQAFLRIYTNDPGIIEDGVPVLYVCIAALWVYSVSTVLFHGVVSTGSTRVALIIEAVVIVFYLLFVKFIFSWQHTNISIVWTSEIFYWFGNALFALIYLKTGHWKKIKI